MEYKRFDNTIFVRIDKGEEILEQLKAIAIQEHIKLASVSAAQPMTCMLGSTFVFVSAA